MQTNQKLSVKPLIMSSLEGNITRQRKTSLQSRLLVNSDNPLFLFHTIDLFEKSFEESLSIIYNSLPDDIRPFSVIYTDKNTNNKDKEELYCSFEKALNYTDEANIPIFIQTENWNSVATRAGFTEKELSDLLKEHKSLMGFVHVELSCYEISQEAIERMKTTIKACKDNNALFIWQEMEYEGCANTINRAFEDKEFYHLMKEYAHNVIIQDKHNGQGRHFATQAAALGAWLGNVCGNWGSNVEAWLWWEEGFGDYNDVGTKFRGNSALFTLKYPPALAGIDTICDMVGGASVYSSEELYLYEDDMGKIAFTETFWTVVYPLYQRIIQGVLPSKKEVTDNIKVAYQFSSPNDGIMQGIESELFMEAYGGPASWYKAYAKNGTSKKWVPTTGRYYIVPTFCKYVNPTYILSDADILCDSNYRNKVGYTTESKKKYFNSRYAEKYKGSGTMFSVGGLTYILNDHENQTEKSMKNVLYKMKKNGITVNVSMREHLYAIIEEDADGFKMDLTNLRLDTSLVCKEKESKMDFMSAYLKGSRMDSSFDFRETIITLSGFLSEPKILVSGSNNTKATLNYNSKKGIAIITIISNGMAKLTVTK